MVSQDIKKLVERGHYLVAIKRYRETYAVGFSVAEKAVFDLRKDMSIADRKGGHQSDAAFDEQTIQKKVLMHLRAGNKIRAVKCYQSYKNVDYRQAMKAVHLIAKKYLK